MWHPGSSAFKVKVNAVRQNKARVVRSGIAMVARAVGLTTLIFAVRDTTAMLLGPSKLVVIGYV